MNTQARKITFALILLSFAFLGMAFLTSCVNVPLPPFGDRIGELGNLQLALSAKYIPNTPPESPGENGMAFAWSKYGEAKLLRDK
jgi:hypothetical protein